MARIRKECIRVLRHLGVDESAELDVSIVGPAEMRQLNRDYRGKDQTTDVLSFPMQDCGGRPPFRPAPGSPVFPLGDIVLDAERVSQQAMEAGHTAAREYRILLVHGILHLLGYDHEAGQGSARTMRRREREVLEYIKESS